ncbi:MAG: YraN family protein [Halothiobacillaceae bacterium]|jgi:putative endonuclease|nr:YraN family protein [Halothiobacillaceae bacterium]MDY0050734.1 YraN family protein [Halothiobacillaceae bacterium]
MPPSAPKPRGAQSEDLARAHLEKSGLTWITANYRARQGEIDLIMRDGATLVFVEVRARSARGLVGALDSLTAAKLARLRGTAESYLAAHPRLAGAPCRFDVVALSWPEQGRPHIEWLKDAF